MDEALAALEAVTLAARATPVDDILLPRTFEETTTLSERGSKAALHGFGLCIPVSRFRLRRPWRLRPPHAKSACPWF